MGNEGRFEFRNGDVRDASAVASALKGVTEIYHLAGQVAVSTAIDDPMEDFDINLRGTLNVLEAARLSGDRPFLFFASTNKVYGALDKLRVIADDTRYRALDEQFRGVPETELLDFYSPYSCSKGAADQYVRDYGRIYDFPIVVFRLSCIAGPRQYGTEDQGWIAHFVYSVNSGNTITIYGDGLQVRDVLHVDDLLDAIEAVLLCVNQTHGQIYNVGGGMDRAASVIELLHLVSRVAGRASEVRYAKRRVGDQPLYISDTAKLFADTGWRPRLGCRDVVESIQRFWDGNAAMLRELWNC
jgi:CDP-paratose 2-epimerase